MVATNNKVKTPIGDGVCQGGFSASAGDGNSQLDEKRVLVRIDLTEENRHLLGRSNCMTPHARESALFVFVESELA